MKILWCWRCKMEIPMLEPDEAYLVWQQANRGLSTLTPEEYLRIYDEHRGNRDRLQAALQFENESGGMLREYCRITGFKETNVNALWHHQTYLYGPPCRYCGKPLRTPQAKLCGACMRTVQL